MALQLTAASSEYLDITSGLSGFPANGEWTIAGWIYLRSAPPPAEFYFYNHSTDGTFSNGDVFSVSNSSVIRLTTADEVHHVGQLEDWSGTTVLATGEWYFFAAVCNGGSIEVSIDLNVEITSSLRVSDRDAITSMVLGNYVGGGSFYANMQFWGWKMWTAALDGSEVSAEMGQGWPVRTADLWAHWDFEPTNRPNDDGAGGHNWTEHNTPSDAAAPAVPLGAPTGGVGAGIGRSLVGGSFLFRGLIG